jgi:hypothetical protein
MKKITFEQKEKAIKQKRDTIRKQGGLCSVCDKPFTVSDPPEASHRIPKGYESVYGSDIIHHPFNVPVCHKTCNSAVLIAHDTQSGKDLIETIKEDLLNRFYVF